MIMGYEERTDYDDGLGDTLAWCLPQGVALAPVHTYVALQSLGDRWDRCVSPICVFQRSRLRRRARVGKTRSSHFEILIWALRICSKLHIKIGDSPFILLLLQPFATFISFLFFGDSFSE